MEKSVTLTGGCQCGAVRFEWLEQPQHSSVCYCRMCQKASGQPFMAFAGGKKEMMRWIRGAPATYQSSNIAERGFCAQCGTPLTYSRIGSGRISCTINSFDDPETVPPRKQYGTESKVSWMDAIGELPAQRTDEWLPKDVATGFVNKQKTE